MTVGEEILEYHEPDVVNALPEQVHIPKSEVINSGNKPYDKNILRILDIPPPSEDWQLQARCKGEDTEIFYEVDRTTPAAKHAMWFCVRCPVRRDCLSLALSTQEERGLWGGMTERERRKLLRAVRRRLEEDGEV